MSKVTKMDQFTQYKLTSAIQKAASLSLASTKDTSQILAKQLQSADIPKHLTKLATTAFNRRLAVRTLGSRKDQNKAQDFPIADVHKVQTLRGMDSLQKTASVYNDAFVFKVQKPQMKKVASKEQKVQKELTVQQTMKKLQSFIDAAPIAFQNTLNNFLEQQNKFFQLKKSASAALNKDQKLSQLFSTVYGDSFTEVFKDSLPEQNLKKYAAFAILPQSKETHLVQEALRQHQVVQLKSQALQLKKQATQLAFKQAIQLHQGIKDGLLNGLFKKADGYSIIKDIAANAITVPVLTGANAAKGAIGASQEVVKGVSDLLSQRIAVSPKSAITGQLINTDKYDDKFMRLVDILADKDFSAYSARDIQKAVQDTLIQRPQFLSPRFKQHLKTAIQTRLLQGNKTNEAAQAAYAATAKAIAQGDKNRRDVSPEAVVTKLNDTQTAGSKLSDIMPSLSKALQTISDDVAPFSNLDEHWTQWSKSQEDQRLKQEASQQKRRQQNLKAVTNYVANRQKLYKALTMSGIKHSPAYQSLLTTNRGQSPKSIKYQDLSLTQRKAIRALVQQQAAKLTPQQIQSILAMSSSSKSKSKSKKTP